MPAGIKLGDRGKRFTAMPAGIKLNMRVIGIDPGSRVCGYGVLETQNGNIAHIAHGSIAPKSTLELSQRLKVIYDGLVDVITKHRPEAVSIEDIFFAKNARSAIKLGQARGGRTFSRLHFRNLNTRILPHEGKARPYGKG